MKYILSLCCLVLCLECIGQGNVEINTTGAINKMMEDFTIKNKSEETIKGWRIQIITTDDRRKMESEKGKFSSLYPGVKVKWNHVAPYYRVKVGAYETKMELMGFLLELKQKFPGVIPVMDDLKKSELIEY